MLIEGFREIRRALQNRHPVTELFVCPDLFKGENEDGLIATARRQNAEIVTCSAEVFRKMSYRDGPDGLLAVAPSVTRSLNDLALPDPALIVVAQAIEKPGNLGTILRSADAAGVHAVIVCDRCTDINNPNVVRASIGTLFALPVVETETAAALAWLGRHDIRIVAATPHAETLYTAADLTRRVAIVLGTEQYGLSPEWLAHDGVQVRIPMRGQADSLNVAQAATLLLYEALRQRTA
jgi:TrmH family RNA methyltransferase